MPYGIAETYLVMMPVLQAEEALRAIVLHSAAAGIMDKSDRDSLLRLLKQQAQGPTQARTRVARSNKKSSRAARRILLASMGIAVEE